jgi:hypothetical protein
MSSITETKEHTMDTRPIVQVSQILDLHYHAVDQTIQITHIPNDSQCSLQLPRLVTTIYYKHKSANYGTNPDGGIRVPDQTKRLFDYFGDEMDPEVYGVIKAQKGVQMHYGGLQKLYLAFGKIIEEAVKCVIQLYERYGTLVREYAVWFCNEGRGQTLGSHLLDVTLLACDSIRHGVSLDEAHQFGLTLYDPNI